jgi:hypothetical protein
LWRDFYNNRPFRGGDGRQGGMKRQALCLL